MMLDLNELLKSFRLAYEKHSIKAYIVKRPSRLEGHYDEVYGPFWLYGTGIHVEASCPCKAWGRYLMWIRDEAWGVFIIEPLQTPCRLTLSHEGLGIRQDFELRPDEALVVMARLARCRRGKREVAKHTRKVLKCLELEGDLVYSDANQEFQAVRITHADVEYPPNLRIDEMAIGDWTIRALDETYATLFFARGLIALLVDSRGGLEIWRAYKALRKSIRLAVLEPGQYLIVVLYDENS